MTEALETYLTGMVCHICNDIAIDKAKKVAILNDEFKVLDAAKIDEQAVLNKVLLEVVRKIRTMS